MRELVREALGWLGYLERGQVLVQLQVLRSALVQTY